MQLSGGLSSPRLSAAAGWVWIAGRVVYALGNCHFQLERFCQTLENSFLFFTPGYSTGLPEKRVNGAFGYIGLLTLLGTSIHTAIQHI